MVDAARAEGHGRAMVGLAEALQRVRTGSEVGSGMLWCSRTARGPGTEG